MSFSDQCFLLQCEWHAAIVDEDELLTHSGVHKSILSGCVEQNDLGHMVVPRASQAADLTFIDERFSLFEPGAVPFC